MEKIIENFRKHGFEITIFDTSNEAKDYLSEKIKNKTVIFGGSITAVNMGLHEALAEENTIFNHSKDGFVTKSSDIYIASANGLSKDGKIVNIDGYGNRVSATIYNTGEVYLVCGINKLEDTLEKAIYRAKNVAAPLNARRLNKKTPCAEGNVVKCFDCSSPERICAVTAIMDKKPTSISHFEIVLINENLGF